MQFEPRTLYKITKKVSGYSFCLGQEVAEVSGGSEGDEGRRQRMAGILPAAINEAQEITSARVKVSRSPICETINL